MENIRRKKKIAHANENRKGAEVAIITDKTDFESKDCHKKQRQQLYKDKEINS